MANISKYYECAIIDFSFIHPFIHYNTSTNCLRFAKPSGLC